MLRTFPSRFYKHNIYPEIKDRRGATRLKKWLDSFAYQGIPSYNGQPENIFEAGQWDNCFILDACRFDLYRDCFPDEEIEKRVTLGSSSADFVRKTFNEGDFKDVVYVTGNPHFSRSKFYELTGRKPEDVFHTVFQTWKTDWIEGKGRPSTEAIIRDAKTARNLYPEKKLVVHFMKPHHPFNYDFTGFDKPLDGSYENSVWAYGERGELSWRNVRKGYSANLLDVMGKVRDLSERLEGETVATSDHGNLCGENGMGHHPSGRDLEPLREVPWVEL